MPTRDIGLTDHLDESVLQRLREAARIGFADIEEGRYRDIELGDLEDFVAEIGRRANAALRSIR
jgi:antitoxin ParD1/3/4